jgi:transcriptional regulator NrdR family protein
VAYVRYASVYREFKAVDDFIEEIQILERKQVPAPNQPELFAATT